MIGRLQEKAAISTVATGRNRLNVFPLDRYSAHNMNRFLLNLCALLLKIACHKSLLHLSSIIRPLTDMCQRTNFTPVAYRELLLNTPGKYYFGGQEREPVGVQEKRKSLPFFSQVFHFSRGNCLYIFFTHN